MAHRNGQWLDLEDQGALIGAAAQELVAAGVVRPLDRADGAAVRLWRDMDLCAVLEPAFGEAPDPSALSGEERKAGWRRLGKGLTSPRFEYETPYWLLHEGQPAGTMTLAQMLRGPDLVSVGSLYVLPAHRGQGISTRVLRASQEAMVRAGLGGVRLETYWVWQKTVRYYLSRKFWLFHWKHDVALLWHHDLPDYRVEMDGEEARFLVQAEDQHWDVLIRAKRHGDRLEIKGPKDKSSHALGTFSLWLALAGWPLVRSAEDWREHRYCEGWNPEGLARRIQWFEALAHEAGWVVRTPRIPGLRYGSVAELKQADEAPLETGEES